LKLYCNPLQNDKHWSEAGLFQLLASSSLAASTSFGNMYLEYEIRFCYPQYENPTNIGNGAAWNTPAPGTGLTDNNAFGTACTKLYDTVGFPPVAAGVVTAPPGAWMLNVRWSGTGFVTNSSSIAPVGGASINFLSDWHVGDATEQNLMVTYWCDGESTIQPKLSTSTTITGCDVYIICLPYDAVVTLAALYPTCVGPLSLMRAEAADHVQVDWKLPVRLIEEGTRWLAERSWLGRFRPYMRGFSRLVGWILDSGLLGAVDLTTVPPGCLKFWKECGFRVDMPRLQEEKKVERKEVEYVEVRRR
jgi:hypothetical protein